MSPRHGTLAPLQLTFLLAACAPLGCGGPPPRTTPVFEEQRSGTAVLLQAVSVVDSNVVWVSGHAGSWARTTDGGRSWSSGVVPGADTLEFRDVHAASAGSAWLLSAGPGDLSRIYRTDDGGGRWTLQWTNAEPAGFYDCMDFWDDRRGIVYGDAVAGALRVLVTEDGGATWRLVPDERLPTALSGEGGFAASGTCVDTAPDGHAWIAAGNAARARVFHTEDFALSWSAADTPVAGGEGAGLTSISMADGRVGTVFGGNLGSRDAGMDSAARTTDGGGSWTPLPALSLPGPVYGGAHVPGTGGQALIAVGPGGVDVSVVGGRTWATLDSRSWWGVGSGGAGASWIVGPDGRVARIRLR